jgi:DNA repair protein RadD
VSFVADMQLRPYQDLHKSGIRAALARARRVLAVAPTGSGKSQVLSSIAADAVAKGNRVYILAHRTELVGQLAETVRRWGIECGIIAPKYPKTDHLCQVASVFTLARRLDNLPAPVLIIQDECHHLVAGNTWGRIIEHWPYAYLLGKTATPERLSGEGLGEGYGGYFREMVVGQSPQWLTDNGFLARARVFSVPTSLSQAKLSKRAGDYDMKQAGQVATELTGDLVRHVNKYLPAPKTAIAFCCNIEHSRDVAATLNAAGIRAEALDGTTADDERPAILGRLATGETRIVTSVAILGEGVDIPSVSGAIMLRPTASLALYLQMAGRSLRPKPDNSEAIILDHAGNALRHGLPTDHHEWSLEGKRRREKQETVSVRQCPECYAALPALTPECPCCGHVFETQERLITVLEGALEELKQTPLKQERAMANTYEDLLKIGIARKMRNPAGWARHVLAARSLKAGRRGVHA